MGMGSSLKTTTMHTVRKSKKMKILDKFTKWHFKCSHLAPKKFKLHSGIKKSHFENLSERPGMAVPY